MKADGQRAQAFWSVPLVAESRPLGLLGAGFYQPRKFSADERAFVETLTSHCAQAFLRPRVWSSRTRRKGCSRRRCVASATQ